jgi:hypothetical protein
LRATHSGPHLGLGQLVEGDRRAAAVCGQGSTGSGGWELGRGREVTWEMRGGGESGVGLFIAEGKAVSRLGLSTRSLCSLRQWRFGQPK